MARQGTVSPVEWSPGVYDPTSLPVFDRTQAWERVGWWNNRLLYREGRNEADVYRVDGYGTGEITVVYDSLTLPNGLYPFSGRYRFTEARESLKSVSALCAPNDTEAIDVINRLMREQTEEEAAWEQKICEDLGGKIVGKRGRLHVLLEATDPLQKDGLIEAKLGRLWGFACMEDETTVPVVAGKDGSIGRAKVPPLSFWLYVGTLE